MTDRIFVDSNIWIYLFAAEDCFKNKIAQEYISNNAERKHLVISYQVVNEVCCVLKKKGYPELDIRRVADDMMGLCEVCGYSGETIYMASQLREKYSLSYWDSQIIASALLSGCGTLASEDMQDGLKIDNMIISDILKLGKH